MEGLICCGCKRQKSERAVECSVRGSDGGSDDGWRRRGRKTRRRRRAWMLTSLDSSDAAQQQDWSSACVCVWCVYVCV